VAGVAGVALTGSMIISGIGIQRPGRIVGAGTARHVEKLMTWAWIAPQQRIPTMPPGTTFIFFLLITNYAGAISICGFVFGHIDPIQVPRCLA